LVFLIHNDSYNNNSFHHLYFQNYIARFGHGSAKLARQAQSKEKTLAKMVASGLTEEVKADRNLTFNFYSCGTIPPPVIMVQVLNNSFNIKKKIWGQIALCARLFDHSPDPILTLCQMNNVSFFDQPIHDFQEFSFGIILLWSKHKIINPTRFDCIFLLLEDL
jgi:hypothetical protein